MGIYKQALYKMAEEETSANVGRLVGYPEPKDRLRSDYFTPYPGTTAPVPRSEVGRWLSEYKYGANHGPISTSSLERARRAQAEVAAGKFAPQHTPLYNRLRDAFIHRGRSNYPNYQKGKFAPGKSNVYFEYPAVEEMEQYKVLPEEQKQAIQDQYKEMVYNNNANTGYRHA